MEEMKEAWLMYGKKDKSRFKPLFSFDEIADVDRGIYEQINNPLILRIFLEIYSGKKLLSKGKKVLNIWEDWFRTFSQDEKSFMQLLADKVWKKGVNELLLDDLLKDRELKDYLISDALNSPYQRLKNLGWISRFTKDLDIVLGFTVEGLLLYVLAMQLEERGEVDVHFIDNILDEGSPIKKSAIEQYLSLEAAKGDISLVTTLIDAEGDYTSLCLKPLLNFIKVEGVEAMVDEVLADPTDGDWEALDELDSLLEMLTSSKERNVLALEASSRNNYDSLISIRFGLKMITLLDDDRAREYFKSISRDKVNEIDDAGVYVALADVYSRFADYNLALEYYQKSLEINLKVHGELHQSVGTNYNSLGLLLKIKGEPEKALEYYTLSIKIKEQLYGENHPGVAVSYNNIGVLHHNNDNYSQALKFYKKSLKIKLQLHGNSHPSVAMSYHNEAGLLDSQKDFDGALELYKKSLKILIKIHGETHADVASCYNSIAGTLNNKGEINEALEYYKKSLRIRIQVHGEAHPYVATSLNNIGLILIRTEDYNKALEYCDRSLRIRLKVLGDSHPSVGRIYENIGSIHGRKAEYDKAIDYFGRSLNVQIKAYGEFHLEVAKSHCNFGSFGKV